MNSTNGTNPTADEHCSAVASNVGEVKKLNDAGFEYVCNHDGVMLFRKRK